MKLSMVLFLVGLSVFIWATDWITLQGERTIYTVQCRGGVWEGWRCTRKLEAGDRYRFRASKSRQEVVFWIAGSRAPSGKFTECAVQDRDNWRCSPGGGQPSTITHELMHGTPANGIVGLDLPFHAVRKWKWWILRWGMHVFANADY